MKRTGKQMLSAFMCLILAAAAALPSFAASPAADPVEAEFYDLQLDASGQMSWQMELPEEYADLVVQRYNIVMDIMTTGSWREEYRKFSTEENSADITFALVGIYRFRVRAVFVGGLVSVWSDYSNECTVTEDYVTKYEPSSGGSSGGPGVSGGTVNTGTSGGPGTVSSSVPAWVEKSGTWVQDGGFWYYRNNGEIYKNKWACIYNSYAKPALGQRVYDWFCFDESGKLRTGWYTEPGGDTYYLNPVSDGTKGKMVTGWQYIDGYHYYFNDVEGSGRMGALLRNTIVDGARVDEAGRRIS